MIITVFRRRRQPSAILSARNSRSSPRLSLPVVKFLAILVTSAFLLFGTITLVSFLSKHNLFSISAASNSVAKLLSRAFSKGSLRTSHSVFTSLHPILTRRVTPDVLHTIIKNRRRITDSVVNNTLITACSSVQPITARVLSSWISIHGVQQIVIVHSFSSVDDVHHSLSLIDDVDKPGQIVYVAIETRRGSARYPSPSPSPHGRVRRWPRTRAYNLGAKIASGHNFLFVDCRTVVSADTIVTHPIVHDSMFVRVGEAPSDGSGVRPVQMVYVHRRTFFAVHGMDERIDIPGFDMADFVERATRETSQAWRFMHTEASQEVPNLDDAPLVIDIAADKTHTDPTSAHYPELVLYITALSRGEMPPWTGILPNGDPAVISLQDVNFRMLRTQSDPFDDPHRFRFRVGQARRVDFRFWLHASVPDHSSESLINALPHDTRASVVLQAHRKLLHDHYGLPWKLLDIIEMPDKSVDVAQNNVSSADVNTSQHFLDENAVSAKQLNELLKTWRYTSILFNIVWRKAKLLVVNIEADTAMELVRSINWALTLAIVHTRTLVVTGDLRGTALVHLLDVDEMRRILRREYHVSIDILAREEGLECSLKDSNSRICWPNDDAHKLWVESRLRTGITDVIEDPSQHMLVHIDGREVLSWDNRANSTDWLRQVEEQSFACLSVSQHVLDIADKLQVADLNNRTAIWITRSSRGRQAVRTFVARYQHHSHNFNTSNGTRPLIISSDDSDIEIEHESGRRADAYFSMADLWIAIQCERIVFDTNKVPDPWEGIDGGLTEWRRVHGVGGGSNETSVAHLRAPDLEGIGLSFHEMILNAEAVIKTDSVTGQPAIMH